MSRYKTKTIQVFNQEMTLIIRDDGAQIPTDEMNPDYLEYVQWLFDGNTAEEWQPDTTESVES